MEDKLKIAAKLDYLSGYIEGWPGSNPKDLEFFRRMQEIVGSCSGDGLSSTCKPGSVMRDANMKALVEMAPVL